MQIPYNNGSPEPYGQPNGPRGSSPYSQSPSHHHTPSQPPYGPPSQGYGQQGYQPYTPPPQQTYGRYDDYQPPAQYGGPRPSQGQYEPPYQSHSPYYSPGSQPPVQQGAAADYLSQGQQGPPPPGSNSEEDRGVMGALAGGAAGAWAGHKVHHGFLGALGGAFAGHKLQDAVQDHNKHKKDEEKYHKHSPSPPPQHQQQQHQHQQRSYAGNFTASCTQMSLDGDLDLIASCGRVDGSRKLSSISLNRCLTNADGHLYWERDGNFAASARNVRLVDGGRVLEAELKNCGGQWVWDRIVLDEKISNDNGNLVML
ncbi:CNVH-domain-containing protein [Cryphonectria parasitica EP155]|uniref:CNVH-domain-containing protein n=1 Tax=Cryphonectria parasitica (strain ATCC 38755 / EP155) TaxID=660469 RepID=A0A9P5CN28_CRYP1|nr:CNVH-domain-containing protein [Cryphonectria parasitica EP155]KAF3764748.1 CNVH-domain-containing protein [Cryphonectria parasitica EP155]